MPIYKHTINKRELKTNMLPLQEVNFWKGWDVAMGEDLELGCPPHRVQLEEAGR